MIEVQDGSLTDRKTVLDLAEQGSTCADGDGGKSRSPRQTRCDVTRRAAKLSVTGEEEYNLSRAMARIAKVTRPGQMGGQTVSDTMPDEQRVGGSEVSSQEKAASSDFTRPRLA